jgi:exo-beta-1,3-glucanase (GH17 family)/cellulose synthase/poly-beta-1,6-N-acetylglucosamine synthase-like glycosyltransferase
MEAMNEAGNLMTRANLIISVAVAALLISILALMNRPEPEPAWPTKISGYSFSPLREHQDASRGIYPSTTEIDADLRFLQGKTRAVRSYTVADTLGEIPALAAPYGFKVTVGAWIDGRLESNEAELAKAIEIVNQHPNVNQLMVGNEVMLRADVSKAQLIDYLERARKAVNVPVGTAEPWHVWIRHPELAEHVDFIAVHMLPYWEGVPVDQAATFVAEKMKLLKETFPNKRIVIGEVGWPSNGRTRFGAVASESNEAIFLRQFLNHAEKKHYEYFVMEAFDQPWKQRTEGAVGAYWGVYNLDRQQKFEFTKPIVKTPEWRVLGVISVVVAVIILTFFFADSSKLKTTGRSFLAIVAYAAASAAVWIVYGYTQQYMSFSTVTVGVLLIVGMIGVVVVLLIEAHEWAEAHWIRDHRRAISVVREASDDLPMVSIHVPCYNEPPDMVIETLDALARLDYPNFEVIVIDNNTKDQAVWQPVEFHCAKLGDRFRFFHVDPLAGFKAGALNFALEHTDSEAEIIGVIDSDYTVDPSWLRDLVPQFQRPSIAIVQAPQDYRDGDASAFKAMCYAEYRGFFHIGMITRNERNAIIQHGTMTLVRRSVMDEVKGWGEWCITEDADLGLRIFEHGYEANYIAKSYGRGVMPDTFTDFKKQRLRWAYGAMQILRHHAGELFGGKKTHLNGWQKYHFIGGWLPWVADGMNLIFNLAALAWSLAMIIWPHHVDPPLMMFSMLPLAFFVFKIAKMIYLYRARVKASVGQTISAAIAGLALSHTISLAILSGLVTKSKPFFRTPKLATNQRLLKALADSREEGILLLAIWGSVIGLFFRQGTGSLDLLLWVIVMLVQSIPYLSAVWLSMISAFPSIPARWVGEARYPDVPGRQ